MIQFNTYFSEERKCIDIPTQKTLLREQNNKCTLCAIYLTDIKDHKNYHVDHIIPLNSLSKYNFYGSNDIENLQLLCNPCHKWKTREFEKNMLVSILQNHDCSEISKDFLLDKELENYIKYFVKQLNKHLCDIDNDKITNMDIETHIKKYNDFVMNKLNTLNSNNNLKCIYQNDYITYIDDIIYSFIDNLAFLEKQYENKLYNIQEYINMKNKYIDFYMISSKIKKQKKDKLSKEKNNKFSNFGILDNSNEFSETTEMNRSFNEDSLLFLKKIKRNDYDCNSYSDNETITKKRRINIT